jgi:imidazolonepropionase-like amidohydrolase
MPPRLILRNANLFDSVTATLRPGTSVAILGERIEAVGPDLPVTADAQVIDIAGRTLLPGLIDAHVHVTATIPDFFRLTLLPQTLIAAPSTR